MLKKLPVDTSLTPINCQSRGFEWMQDIIDLVEKEEYILGEAAKNFTGNMYGLYLQSKKDA